MSSEDDTRGNSFSCSTAGTSALLYVFILSNSISFLILAVSYIPCRKFRKTGIKKEWKWSDSQHLQLLIWSFLFSLFFSRTLKFILQNMGRTGTAILTLAHQSAVRFGVLCQAPSWTLEMGEQGFSSSGHDCGHLGSLVTYWDCIPQGGQGWPGEHHGYLLLCCQGWVQFRRCSILCPYLSGGETWEVPGGHSPQTLPLAGEVPFEWHPGDSSYYTCMLWESASLEIRCATQSL